jgi:hypothetical protein
MATFDVFISHSSKNKELARFAFYNGVSNGLKPWFDEALIHVGDDIRPVLRQGIADSRAYLLLHSKARKIFSSISTSSRSRVGRHPPALICPEE